MWKKEDGQTDSTVVDAATRPTPTRSSSGGRATIGPSISIRGDVTGSEDLLIEGQVDGSVTLDLHSVSIGSEGRVNANITGRVITVEGRVEGDLVAQEQIVLRGTAQVQGDIKAPRVVLEDGATFRGLVDMGAYEDPKAARTSTTDKASAEKSANGSVAANRENGASGDDAKSDKNGSTSAAARSSSTSRGKDGGDTASQPSL